MKALIISCKNNALAEGQIYPFHLYARELKDQLGFVFDTVEVSGNDFDYGYWTSRIHKYDLVFMQSRALPKITHELVDFLQGLVTKKILLDSSANIGGAFYLLPNVDIYLKKQIYVDFENYSKNYWDGRVFSDFLIEKYSSDLGMAKENLCKSGPLAIAIPDEYKDKLMLGWNTATMKYFYEKFHNQDFKSKNNSHRTIDINCRVRLVTSGAPLTEHWSRWYYYHRMDALTHVQEMSAERCVVAEGFLNKYNDEQGNIAKKYTAVGQGQMLPLKDYWKELENSKICVSPFGMAEICLRDFEAIIAGCLLVKPDMQHLATEPNIYLPHVTYVPVKWDLSDLKEKCEYYLEHEKEREAIVHKAAEVYAAYFHEKKFVGQVKNILIALGFAAEQMKKESFFRKLLPY